MLRPILIAALVGALLGCSGQAARSDATTATTASTEAAVAGAAAPAGSTAPAGPGSSSGLAAGTPAATAPGGSEPASVDAGTGSGPGGDAGTATTAAGAAGAAGAPVANSAGAGSDAGSGSVAGSGAVAGADGEQRSGGASPVGGGSASTEVERLRVQVLERYPHDPGAFTQGLLLDGGVLYESTGLEGATTLRRVDVRSGTVLASRPQAADVFGEGLALVGDELIQLSWRNGLAFVHDATSLEPKRRHTYTGEGWGLCYDGQVLWHSDGSNTLRRRDPVTFAELGTVAVLDRGAALSRLNELECVGRDIYANVWLTTEIVRIDAATGRVTARIDAAALVPPGLSSPDDVLNGIAYDPADGTFLLTGKRWPTLYRVTFEPTG